MKKIFRKDLYIESEIKRIIKLKDYKSIEDLAYSISKDGWVPECDGKEAVDGKIGGFFILDVWCEEVEDEEDNR